MASQTNLSQVDALIIGAGLSGLVAAAFLAREGARVLVCEQSGQVGGLFNSFWREGYQFDGGIKAVENSAVMMPMLAQLGLLERIAFHRSPIALITGGCLQPVRGFGDVEAYFALLGELYPGERAGLGRVLRDTRTVFDLLDAMLCFPIPFFDRPGVGKEARSAWMKEHTGALTLLPRAAALMNRELRPYLRGHLRHPGLVNLLSGLFPDGTSAFFGLGYFRMFLDYHYPEGGVRAIPETLAGAVSGWGGEIRLHARVRRILLEGGQARGVLLESGEEIRAGWVIAASDMRQALNRLLPEETPLPAKFAGRLARAEVSQSVFNVFLGVDLPVDHFGLQGCQHIFYSPDLEGISEADRVGRSDYFAHVPQEISIPCLHQPGLAPPGKTGINISAMAAWNYRGGWELPAREYAARKERFARDLIGSLEKLYPGLSEHIELCVAATPRTIASLTANDQGAIMGWSYHHRRTMPRGNFLQLRASVLTPVPNLLAAGHWAFSPGGSPVAVLTGKLAAEHVLLGGKTWEEPHETGK